MTEQEKKIQLLEEQIELLKQQIEELQTTLDIVTDDKHWCGAV